MLSNVLRKSLTTYNAGLRCMTNISPQTFREGIVFPATILRIPESSTALSEFSRGGK